MLVSRIRAAVATRPDPVASVAFLNRLPCEASGSPRSLVSVIREFPSSASAPILSLGDDARSESRPGYALGAIRSIRRSTAVAPSLCGGFARISDSFILIRCRRSWIPPPDGRSIRFARYVSLSSWDNVSSSSSRPGSLSRDDVVSPLGAKRTAIDMPTVAARADSKTKNVSVEGELSSLNAARAVPTRPICTKITRSLPRPDGRCMGPAARHGHGRDSRPESGVMALPSTGTLATELEPRQCCQRKIWKWRDEEDSPVRD